MTTIPHSPNEIAIVIGLLMAVCAFLGAAFYAWLGKRK